MLLLFLVLQIILFIMVILYYLLYRTQEQVMNAVEYLPSSGNTRFNLELVVGAARN